MPISSDCGKFVNQSTVNHSNSLFLDDQRREFFMAKEKIINIRVEAELKRKAKQLAEHDGRSLSNWILRLIKHEIEAADKKPGRK
jgi:predicted HicB family RNase H-like nuclease